MTEVAAARYAGTRVHRVEDGRLLTGAGTFVDDVDPAGDAARLLRAQPDRPGPHPRHRHERGARAARGARGVRRRRPQPRRARGLVQPDRSRHARHAPAPARRGRGALRRRPRRARRRRQPLHRRGRGRARRRRLRAVARPRRLRRRRRERRAGAPGLPRQRRGCVRGPGAGAGRRGVRRRGPHRRRDDLPAVVHGGADRDAGAGRRVVRGQRRAHDLVGHAGAARGARVLARACSACRSSASGSSCATPAAASGRRWCRCARTCA